MIFKQWQQVLDGTKTQTRRPVKAGESELCSLPYHPHCLSGVRTAKGWRKWLLWNTYAVQPGRGKKAVGRIRITKIRRERLQEITNEDCQAEGLGWDLKQPLIALATLDLTLAFRDLWNSLYRKPYRWEDDPEVWVLEFERVEATK